jgi:putative ABC transport system permease protein
VRGLSRLAWRSLSARRLRTSLTIVGIALGVGVLFASLATSAGIESSIERTVDDLVGRADLRVTAFQERGLSAQTIATIAAAPGVDVTAPALERRTYLRQELGDPTLPTPVMVLGIDPATDAEVHDLALVDGSALARPDEASVLITERLARDDGYELGSELTLQAGGDPERFRVIGIVAGDGPLVGAFGRTVVIPIDAARRVFGMEGATRVDVVLAAGATTDDVEAALVERLVAEPYVLSSPRDIAASLRASTTDFQSTTALIAAVALFVGAFLIFSTLSMTLGERIREVGLLRAAGATRRQVTGFILTGALAIGLLGSVLGLVVGLALAALMVGWVRSIGSIPLDGLDAPLSAFLVAAAVGVVVTIAAALEPARRASRISPIEALKARADADVAVARAARLRWLVAIFVAVGAIGVVVWPFGAAGGVARALAVYGVLLVATLASPFLLRPLGRLAGMPFAALVGFEERLARGSLVRDRSRAALTVGALAMGLAMIVAIGGVAQNARRAATAWLVDVVPGDEVVTSIRPIAQQEGMTAILGAVPGVERATPIATFDLAFGGLAVDAAAIVGADFLADGRLVFVEGERATALAALDRGGVAIVPRGQAERLAVGLDDVLRIAVGGGTTVDLRVVAIVERGLPGGTGETVFVGWDDARTSFGVLGADFFAVRFKPGQAGVARQSLEAQARTLALEPSPLDRVQGAVANALGRVFGLFDALAVVAVVVAALGIVNTLTMNVVERVREIGVLRATGMTRRQVGRMVVVEAGILGLVGAIIGALAGLAAGAALVALAGGRLDLPIDPPWGALVLCFLLGVGASMLAAYYPARLAGGLSIVRAVQFE